MFLRTVMSVIKLEVRLSEVTQALEAFASHRKQALEQLSYQMKELVSTTFNQLMNAEMDLFLGQPDQAGNKRNGYREREYTLKGIGTLRIRVPKDRRGQFSSVVVPPHERVDPRIKADMAILHLAGLSTRMLAMISKRLLGIEVSKDTVSGSLGLIKDEARAWLTRPLTDNYWALYVDGTNFKVQRRGSVAKEPSLVVLGVSSDNRRSILAIEPGTRDNTSAWRVVFRELKQRGLNANAVRLGIMDGLPGLEKLFKEEFPNAVTARCWAHAMRNAVEKTPARLREAFKPMPQRVMYAANENDAREAFLALKQAFNGDALRAIHCLEKDLESLLVHYRFDQRCWIALKTTNAIERINKEFKRRTKSMETVGESTLEAVVAFAALRLELGWRSKPINSLSLGNLKNLKNTKEVNVIENVIEEIGLLN